MTREEREEQSLAVKIRSKHKNEDEFPALLATVYPESAEREYKRILGRYEKKAAAIIRRCMREISRGRNKKAAIKRARSALDKLVDRKSLEAETAKIATMVTGIEERQFRRSVKKTVDISIPKLEGFEEEENTWSAGAVAATVLMIRELSKSVGKAQKAPVALDELEKTLRQTHRITGAARDRVGNFVSTITMNIFRRFGIGKYEWRSRRDNRVRECHAWLDGQVFKWSEPPEMWYRTLAGIVYTGRHCHPGQDYNCRCNAIPLFSLETIRKIIKLRGRL
ncbi:MAG: minor capsid protein [Lachnospiraceae bacterium]|nr:minor capsid protein [Lachnospiraceae bacterium]